MSATFSPVDPAPRTTTSYVFSAALVTRSSWTCGRLAAMSVAAAEFTTAMRQLASGVCLLTVRDDIDDVGTTVSSVMSVSADPPLIAVGLAAGGYPAEVL